MLGAFTTESDSSFHSEIVLGKKELLYALLDDFGNWKHLLFRFWISVSFYNVLGLIIRVTFSFDLSLGFDWSQVFLRIYSWYFALLYIV